MRGYNNRIDGGMYFAKRGTSTTMMMMTTTAVIATKMTNMTREEKVPSDRVKTSVDPLDGKVFPSSVAGEVMPKK